MRLAIERDAFPATPGTEGALREYRILDPQGQVRWIRDRRFYLYDQGGQLTRLGGIAEDVSESKQREDRQDDFLAVVTHELRSPLNAMRGWTHVLRRAGALNPLQVKALEAIDRSNQAQARLMDEFQDQQRILQGHVKLQYTRTNLSALLDESVTAVQEQAQAKGIRIEVRQERSLGLISADAHRLRQALTVLLANAIKLNPENGSISVSTRQGSDGLFIEVRDSGDSLPLTEMPSARLGLHLARQVVALHGGQLTVRHEGQQAGTTFIIELPDKLRLTNPAPLPDLATNG